jgi:hypothetical protein
MNSNLVLVVPGLPGLPNFKYLVSLHPCCLNVSMKMVSIRIVE